MADYYPLLARALKALPEPSASTRKAVYDRARQALIGQLRSLDPPLTDDDIEHERKALDAAIERLETDFGGVPAKAPAPPAAEPVPAPVVPVAVAPVTAAPPPPEPAAAARPPEPEAPPAALPAMPPAAAPTIAPAPRVVAAPTPASTMTEATPDEPAQRPSEPILVASRGHFPEPEPPSTPPLIVPARPRSRGVPAEQSVEPSAEGEASGGSRQQRPRLDVRPVPGRRARLLRNLAVALVLLVVMGLIAAAAWALRDKPSDLIAASGQGPSTRATDEATKLADRVGTDRPSAQAGTAGQGSAPAPAAPVQAPASGVAVAQRATLYEENTADAQAAPRALGGRAVWRLDAVNGGQGQPLQTVIRAVVEIPEAGNLTLTMTIRRNLDATLPASHTIELAFTNTGADPNRTVRDVGLLQLKDDQNGRGSPVSGLPVPVRDNLFLIGLSNLPSDADRNADLLQSRNWIDLPLRYASGGRAILSFEKGTPGDRVIRDAFAQWQQ